MSFLPWKLNGLETHVWRFTISRHPSGPMMHSNNTKTHIRSGPIWHRYGGGSFQHMICLFIMMKTWYYRSWKKSGQTVVINKTLQLGICLVYQVEDCFINNIIRNIFWNVLEKINHLQQVEIHWNYPLPVRVTWDYCLRESQLYASFAGVTVQSPSKILLNSLGQNATLSKEIKCCKVPKKNIRIIPQAPKPLPAIWLESLEGFR